MDEYGVGGVSLPYALSCCSSVMSLPRPWTDAQTVSTLPIKCFLFVTVFLHNKRKVAKTGIRLLKNSVFCTTLKQIALYVN